MSGLSDEELLRRLNWTEIYTGGGIVNIIISTTCRGASGGLWGRLALECDVEGHQCEDASRRGDGQSTNIQRVPSCDQSSPLPPHLDGFRSRYIRETSKDVFLFQASISPAEAARTLSEHLASFIARVTLPKRSVPVPSSLVVVQVNILDALFCVATCSRNIVDTYRLSMRFWPIFLPWIRLHTIGKSSLTIAPIPRSYSPSQAATPT